MASAPAAPRSTIEELNSNPAFLLGMLGQEAMRRLRESLTSYGLKPRQVQILDLLAERGPVGQRDLGQSIEIDQSILVTMLNPLEADGFVSRERDAEDRRRHLVSITKAGRRKLADALRKQREVEDAIFAALSDRQRAQLYGLLAILSEANPTQPDKDDC
jgi:DNA-binding MarR family transcriptional regulator